MGRCLGRYKYLSIVRLRQRISHFVLLQGLFYTLKQFITQALMTNPSLWFLLGLQVKLDDDGYISYKVVSNTGQVIEDVVRNSELPLTFWFQCLTFIFINFWNFMHTIERSNTLDPSTIMAKCEELRWLEGKEHKGPAAFPQPVFGSSSKCVGPDMAKRSGWAATCTLQLWWNEITSRLGCEMICLAGKASPLLNSQEAGASLSPRLALCPRSVLFIWQKWCRPELYWGVPPLCFCQGHWILL